MLLPTNAIGLNVIMEWCYGPMMLGLSIIMEWCYCRQILGLCYNGMTVNDDHEWCLWKNIKYYKSCLDYERKIMQAKVNIAGETQTEETFEC